MERLTSKKTWKEVLKNKKYEYGYSHIWKRLNAIENILGDEYDLERLQQLVSADRDESVLVVASKRIYESEGYRLFLIYNGEIVEGINVGAHINHDGAVYMTFVADEKTFPHRQPDSDHDIDPTDWLAYNIELSDKEFMEKVFTTREAAEAALANIRGDKHE